MSYEIPPIGTKMDKIYKTNFSEIGNLNEFLVLRSNMLSLTERKQNRGSNDTDTDTTRRRLYRRSLGTKTINVRTHKGETITPYLDQQTKIVYLMISFPLCHNEGSNSTFSNSMNSERSWEKRRGNETTSVKDITLEGMFPLEYLSLFLFGVWLLSTP